MSKRHDWHTFYDTDLRRSGGLAAASKKLAEKAEEEGWEVFQFLSVNESILGVVCRKEKIIQN